MAKRDYSSSSLTTTTDAGDGQQDATPPRVRLSSYTEADGFNQGIQYAKQAAANAGSLAALQQFLTDLAVDTQALVSSIDTAENSVQTRVRAGVPPPQGNLPPPPPPAPPPPPPDTNDLASDGDKQ